MSFKTAHIVNKQLVFFCLVAAGLVTTGNLYLAAVNQHQALGNTVDGPSIGIQSTITNNPNQRARRLESSGNESEGAWVSRRLDVKASGSPVGHDNDNRDNDDLTGHKERQIQELESKLKDKESLVGRLKAKLKLMEANAKDDESETRPLETESKSLGTTGSHVNLDNHENQVGIRIALANTLSRRADLQEQTHVVFCATIAGNKESIQSSVLPWILYHADIGVRSFFLAYDGTDAGVLDLLQQVQSVVVRPLHNITSTTGKDREENRDFFQRYARKKTGRTQASGNFELMFKQDFAANEAVQWSKNLQGQADWIMHIDQDEFILPLRSHVSFPTYLQSQPPHVSTLKIDNAEATPEHMHVQNPLQDVTLFKLNVGFVANRSLKKRKPFRFHMYANGKSVARVDAPGLRLWGPHDWIGEDSERWIDPQDDTTKDGKWRETTAQPDILLLHYTYTRVEDVITKASRSCPGEDYHKAALSNDKRKLKDCFVFDLDRAAFILATRGNETAIRNWFQKKVVFGEGANIACSEKEADTCTTQKAIAQAMKKGVLRREHTVKAIAESHDRIVRTVQATMALHPNISIQQVLDASVLI